jgi:hypothetical protein
LAGGLLVKYNFKPLIMKKYFYFLLIVPLFYTSCSKGEGEPEPILNNEKVSFIDISQDTDWDIMAVDNENGDYLTVRKEITNKTTAYVKPNNVDKGYIVNLDAKGYPETLIANNYIFIFTNFEGTKVDVSIITPEDNLIKVRDIESEFNWDNFQGLAKAGQKTSDWKEDLHEILKVINIATCVGTIAAAIGTAGIALPAVIAGCNGVFFDVLLEALPMYSDLLGIGDVAMATFEAIGACSGPIIEPVMCIISIADLAGVVVLQSDEVIENSELIIDDLPVRLSSFMSAETILLLNSQGLPIYAGSNPPNIDGNYYCDNLENFNTNHQYINSSFSFDEPLFNFIESSIRVRLTDESSFSEENIGYIVGQSNNFTVFVEQLFQANDSNNNVVKIVTSSIYSGEKTQTGLKGFMWGFVVLEKENDINGEFVNVGQSRIIHESDNLADKVSTYPYTSNKWSNGKFNYSNYFKK